MSGWIKLHRDIEKHWIWKNPQYLQGWIYCIIRANYEENKVLIGAKIEVAKPGSFFTSIGKFSIATGLTIQQTRTFWDLLETNTMINKKATSKRTKITICNYDKYQVKQQTNNKPITNQQQTNNNGEERKEVKEVKEKDFLVVGKEKILRQITENMFDDFWKLYPKKKNKGQALSAWSTVCNRKGDKRPKWKEIKLAIILQKKSEQWNNPRFIPNPSTWLNQRRWMDDPNDMDKPRYEKPVQNTVGSRSGSTHREKYGAPDIID